MTSKVLSEKVVDEKVGGGIHHDHHVPNHVHVVKVATFVWNYIKLGHQCHDYVHPVRHVADEKCCYD